MSDIKIEESWKSTLNESFSKESFRQLTHFLKAERASGVPFYPPGSQIFEAFNRTPFPKVKVVLLGQDPYHGKGQAHGLCFSVNNGVPFPPSLQNIFKAIQIDYPNFKIPNSGNLSNWADQGVLLLNATLTVRAGEAGSHQRKGWEEFTDDVIRQLSNHRNGLVFILWGSYAQSKIPLIDGNRHLILQAPHPSPLSAHRGFFECHHFKLTNDYLEKNGLEKINW